MIIGLSGYARAGKDTIGDYLVEEYGFKKMAFADKMREFLYQVNPVIHEYGWTNINYHIDSYPVRLRDVIDKFGWEGAKVTAYKDEIRGLMQRLGTEAGRETMGENVWVDALFSNLDLRDDIVITDMRFPNEAVAIGGSPGGVTWRVERPGIRPAGDHPSEISLDHWPFDHVLQNDGTVDELHWKIDKHLEATTLIQQI